MCVAQLQGGPVHDFARGQAAYALGFDRDDDLAGGHVDDPLRAHLPERCHRPGYLQHVKPRLLGLLVDGPVFELQHRLRVQGRAMHEAYAECDALHENVVCHGPLRDDPLRHHRRSHLGKSRPRLFVGHTPRENLEGGQDHALFEDGPGFSARHQHQSSANVHRQPSDDDPHQQALTVDGLACRAFAHSRLHLGCAPRQHHKERRHGRCDQQLLH
mmetsp:Transcript_81325/g.233706  ORF Transcript_81325/g.233706 Transcript_81325/m.233706 type:complete len:215 (-) Transcript_81325:375-1019(-)